MKRFIETEIWDKEDFCSATDKQKLLTIFITCKCDAVGVFKMANMLIRTYVGSPVTKEEILSIPCDIEELEEGVYWLSKFCSFQYGDLKESCKPHRKYIKMLKDKGLFERVSKGFQKGIETQQEKEEDKEQEKEEEQDREKRFVMPNWMPVEAWQGFVAMRKQKGKPMTTRAKNGIVNKIIKLGIEDAEKILDQSTECCWQTVWALKEEAFDFNTAPWKELNNGERVKLDMKKLIVYAENGTKHEFMQVDKNGGVFA